MHMAHNIMTELLFQFRRPVIVNVVDIRLKFGNLCVSNIQAKFLLGLCQCDPEFSPGGKLLLRRPDIAHFRAGITVD